MKKRVSVFLVCVMMMFFVGQINILAESSRMVELKPALYLKSQEFKSLSEIKIPAGLEKKGYNEYENGKYIVRFVGPILDEWRTNLEKTGATIYDYIPDFAYLVEMSEATKTKVAKMSYVLETIVYQPVFKLNPDLYDEYGVKKVKDGQSEGTFFVKTFTKDLTGLDHFMINAHGVFESKGQGLAKIKLNRVYLSELAQLDNVKYIEEVPTYHLCNDVADSYVDADDMWNLGYDGTGQIVGICDTGLDTGVNDSSMHLDFQGRIISMYALGRSTADDPHGHGTHVAGSVLGDGSRSSGQIKGMAPNANLVFQSVLDSSGGLGGLPADLNNLFAQAYADGARIHTNSWGASVYGDYTTNSEEVDQFVNNNRDMIILFAASNDGPTLDSIGAPGTAKNCITVGASENYRPEQGSYADDPTDIASFSSRGWTTDGRIKPDVVAPGTWILSARSSLAGDSSFWANYNTYYAYMGGTSMATPITAGTIAVARQYMIANWNHTPNASLMKAVLINGATDLGFGYPSRDQGWGRVSLTDSLTTREIEWVDETINLTTGSSQVHNYTLESSNTPLKISLVWTDVPGSSTSSVALVNDLDLKVTGPDGTVYYGNDFTTPYNTAFDRLNNVENVFVDMPLTGTWTVEVLGYNIPDGPQNYSLVVGGDFGIPINDPNPPSVSIISPIDGATVSTTVTITADATDDIGVARVDFYVDGIYIGRDTTSPYALDWDSTTVQNGTHVLTAKAFDTVGNNTTSTPVNVTTDNVITEQTDIFTGYVNNTGTRSEYHYIDVTRTGTITLELTWDTTSDLDMFLYDPSGVEVARAYTVSKPETITYEATTLGTYEIKVDAYSGSGNYTLTATYPVDGGVTPPPPVNTETLNITDTLKKNSPYIDHTINVGDTDSTIDVTLSWTATTYNLDIYIYNSTGTLVASGTTTDNPEILSYQPTETGTFTVRVQAATTLPKQVAYSLSVTYPI